MKYFNPNPAGLITQDCAYRGLSFFFGISWMKAVFELVTFAVNRGKVNFTYITNISEYLASKGYERHRSPRKGMTVWEFSCEVAKPGRCYLLWVEWPRHITIIDTEGQVCDIADCSSFVVKYYWMR